ncbi:Rv3235 family protein [Streptomyces sp. NPDC092296]|uniref:Rv3235 family protein n=1 Tax=Streptomyces sp. NPDC092296 TaxID=3366012 RepID=UPI0037F8695C
MVDPARSAALTVPLPEIRRLLPSAPATRCPDRHPAPPAGTAVRLGRVHARRVGRPRPAAGAPGAARCAPPRSDLNDLATRFALRLVEVMAGARPAGQLSRHTTHTAYGELALLVRRGALRPAAGGSRPVVRGVYDSAPAPGVLEVCARVDLGPRSRMLAFRLERHPRSQQWQCATVDAR